VSGLYNEIVEFAALPDKPVDPQLIEKLARQLGEYEEAYTTYRGFYEEADGAWRRAMAQDPVNEAEVIELARKRAAALRDWENANKGRKKLYEDTLGELNHHLAGNPRGFWETEVRQRLVDLRNSSTRGTYFETVADPHPADWATSGWQKMELKVSSLFNREYSRSTSFSAGGGISLGLWSFGGSYSRSTQETQAQTKATDLTIQLELLRVNIQRRWKYQDLFAPLLGMEEEARQSAHHGRRHAARPASARPARHAGPARSFLRGPQRQALGQLEGRRRALLRDPDADACVVRMGPVLGERQLFGIDE
jgi:hypothetical protein